MQFLTLATLLFTTAVFAAPKSQHNRKRAECSPPQYRCHDPTTPEGEGWDVCDAQGNWVYGGACGAGQHCNFIPASASPYCVYGPTGCTPGDSMCSDGGILECSAAGTWTETACGTGETCVVEGGSPVCQAQTSGSCTPIAYQCNDANNGWNVCTAWGEWVHGGYCASTETCVFNNVNGSPYCLPA